MSLSRKISIDKVCGIQEDEKTKRTIILVENEGDEIELSITRECLRKLAGYVVVRNFEAFVTKIKNTGSLSEGTA